MSYRAKLLLATLLLGLLGFSTFSFLTHKDQRSLPVIAIANWGPHHSLDETIRGIKDALAKQGLHDKENISLQINHVNFEPTLIMQMLTKLKASHPRVLVALSTPVAEAAKNTFKNTPIVFSAITDPVEAGLLDSYAKPKENITGTTDKQDLDAFLAFAKKLLPNATRVGVLYATAEANDAALVKMLRKAASNYSMEVLAVPIEHPRDIPLRMQTFKGKVDFIYVGVSGPIQPSLPAIVNEADKMHIPVFNADSEAAKKGLVLASFGVSYYEVGQKTGEMVYRLLQGEKIESILPYYPSFASHEGFVNKKRAEKLEIDLTGLEHVTIVD